MLKSFLKRAALGFLIGVLMGDGIAIMTSLMSGGDFLPVAASLKRMCGGTGTAFLVQTIISGIYGAVCFGGISFYDIRSWPMLLSSGVHCAMIVLLFIPTALFLGWFEAPIDFLVMAVIQITVYFAIWLILLLSYRREVKKLNELQQRINNKTDKTSKEEQYNEKEKA